VLNTSSPLSITMSRAQLSPGSRHTARELNNRVNQIARRRASAARNASHSSDQGPGAHKGSSVNHGDAHDPTHLCCKMRTFPGKAHVALVVA
jgi:hypothetical protein